MEVTHELSVELQLRVLSQGPIPVRIAWQRPNKLYVHTGSWGDNPDTWYWYENHTLSICQVWPTQRARGVIINGVFEIAEHDADRAFALVMRKCEEFVFEAYVGIRLLRLLEEANTDEIQIAKRDDVYTLSLPAHAFESTLIESFVFEGDGRTVVSFELPRQPKQLSTVSVIRVAFEPVPDVSENRVHPDSGFVAKLDQLEFAFDRKLWKLPVLPENIMHKVSVESANALEIGLVNSMRLVPISQ